MSVNQKLTATFDTNRWTIFSNDTLVASYVREHLADVESVAIGSKAYRLRLNKPYLGNITLDEVDIQTGVVSTVATATGVQLWLGLGVMYSVTVERTPYELHSDLRWIWFHKRYTLYTLGRPVGQITRNDYWGGQYLIELDSALSLELQVFFFAITQAPRQRAAKDLFQTTDYRPEGVKWK
jgi:hypothetical protein